MNLLTLMVLLIFTSSPLEDKVYICDSNTSTKYHYRANCRGLNACNHKIIEVGEEKALKELKMSLCGWED